jgi:hypothetical protein
MPIWNEALSSVVLLFQLEHDPPRHRQPRHQFDKEVGSDQPRAADLEGRYRKRKPRLRGLPGRVVGRYGDIIPDTDLTGQ